MREGSAAAPVVANLDAQHALPGLHLDVDFGGGGVLGRIGQCLGDRVVGGELDLLGKPPVDTDAEADRDGGAAGQRLERRAQAAFGQDRRVDAPRDLA